MLKTSREKIINKVLARLNRVEKDYVDFFKSQVSKNNAKKLFTQGGFEIWFDGNDEFIITKAGDPIWRSEDTHYEDTVVEFLKKVPEADITPEKLKKLDN